MKSTLTKMTLLMALVIAAAAMMQFRAQAQAVTPRPSELRYQALLMSPIATPDSRSVVAGTSALLIKDRVSGQCFLAVTVGNSVGLSPTTCAE